MIALPAFHFGEVFTQAGAGALVQVLMIDLVLAGDNAIVVGALAAGLPPADRKKVISIGIGAALVLRIVFALLATVLVQVPGLLLIGGALLIWVAWRFWLQLRSGDHHDADAADAARRAPRSLARAAWAVALADVSMSLDNVLGVVGAARQHPAVLVIGLLASVALMGLAAHAIAGVINRYRWIAYGGLATIVYVAGKMLWDGWHDLAPRLALA